MFTVTWICGSVFDWFRVTLICGSVFDQFREESGAPLRRVDPTSAGPPEGTTVEIQTAMERNRRLLEVCLCVCPSIALSLCLSIALSTCLSVSLFLSVCLPVSVSVSLSFSLFLSVCLPVFLSVCLFISLYACLYVCLTLCVLLFYQPHLYVCFFYKCQPAILYEMSFDAGCEED